MKEIRLVISVRVGGTHINVFLFHFFPPFLTVSLCSGTVFLFLFVKTCRSTCPRRMSLSQSQNITDKSLDNTQVDILLVYEALSY